MYKSYIHLRFIDLKYTILIDSLMIYDTGSKLFIIIWTVNNSQKIIGRKHMFLS